MLLTWVCFTCRNRVEKWAAQRVEGEEDCEWISGWPNIWLTGSIGFPQLLILPFNSSPFFLFSSGPGRFRGKGEEEGGERDGINWIWVQLSKSCSRFAKSILFLSLPHILFLFTSHVIYISIVTFTHHMSPVRNGQCNENGKVDRNLSTPLSWECWLLICFHV